MDACKTNATENSLPRTIIIPFDHIEIIELVPVAPGSPNDTRYQLVKQRRIALDSEKSWWVSSLQLNPRIYSWLGVEQRRAFVNLVLAVKEAQEQERAGTNHEPSVMQLT